MAPRKEVTTVCWRTTPSLFHFWHLKMSETLIRSQAGIHQIYCCLVLWSTWPHTADSVRIRLTAAMLQSPGFHFFVLMNVASISSSVLPHLIDSELDTFLLQSFLLFSCQRHQVGVTVTFSILLCGPWNVVEESGKVENKNKHAETEQMILYTYCNQHTLSAFLSKAHDNWVWLCLIVNWCHYSQFTWSYN